MILKCHEIGESSRPFLTNSGAIAPRAIICGSFHPFFLMQFSVFGGRSRSGIVLGLYFNRGHPSKPAQARFFSQLKKPLTSEGGLTNLCDFSMMRGRKDGGKYFCLIWLKTPLRLHCQISAEEKVRFSSIRFWAVPPAMGRLIRSLRADGETLAMAMAASSGDPVCVCGILGRPVTRSFDVWTILKITNGWKHNQTNNSESMIRII